ncbi:hypothetical protein E2C01_094178 [Portunus trituberculatus]|uniref:Uncharacterized protein n=1 Tax=Portunus trituberculatus TaxID=210409 RepID=A0A5B7JWW8_PORTR|nr:hypothetical protein [Portunus trituberculatus]
MTSSLRSCIPRSSATPIASDKLRTLALLL